MATRISIELDKASQQNASKGIQQVSREVANLGKEAGNAASGTTSLARSTNNLAQSATSAAKSTAVAASSSAELTQTYGRQQTALQQLIFAVDDAATVYGQMGLAGAVRAAANNLTQAASLIGGPWALAAAVGATAATQLYMAFSRTSDEIDNMTVSMREFLAQNNLDQIASSIEFMDREVKGDFLVDMIDDAKSAEQQMKRLEQSTEALRATEAKLNQESRKARFELLELGWDLDEQREGEGWAQRALTEAEREHLAIAREKYHTLRDQHTAVAGQLRHEEGLLTRIGNLYRNLSEREANDAIAEQFAQLEDAFRQADAEREERRKRQDQSLAALNNQMAIEINPSEAQEKMIEDERQSRIDFINSLDLAHDQYLQQLDLINQAANAQLDQLHQKHADQMRQEFERAAAAEAKENERHIERLKAALTGQNPDQANVVQEAVSEVSDRQVAMELANRRAEQVRAEGEQGIAAAEAGGANDAQLRRMRARLERDVQRERAQEFRRVQAGQADPSQVEQARVDVAQKQAEQLKMQGKLSGETVQAFKEVAQESLNQTQQIEKLSEEVASMRSFFRQQSQGATRRRAQATSGAN